jgi:hypothetical protein
VVLGPDPGGPVQLPDYDDLPAASQGGRTAAADCAEDGVYEALLTSAPMHASGGIGSPANALALK